MGHPVLQFSLFSVILTQHAHEDLVDPGEDADDVEGGEGDVQEEPDPHLEALVLAALSGRTMQKIGMVTKIERNSDDRLW